MDFTERFIVKPGRKFRLADWDPDYTWKFDSKERAEQAMEKNIRRLADLQYLLYAENKRALLIVLQAMDAGGKDGTIRHVMSGLNPQSCRVAVFKAPTDEELAHDFLWRIHKAVPRTGEVVIFNRSHYEDVLVVRVHDLVDKGVWSGRYDQINAFEQLLHAGGAHILKFFLHISPDEQRQRLCSRLEDPKKNWKATPQDFRERKYWGQYMAAYQDALARCSTEHAPWFVIPANKKWFRNLVVSRIILETLDRLKMRFPKPRCDVTKLKPPGTGK